MNVAVTPVPHLGGTGAIAVPNDGLRCHCCAKAVPSRGHSVSKRLRDAPTGRFSAVPACPPCPPCQKITYLKYHFGSTWPPPPFSFLQLTLCADEARGRPAAGFARFGLFLRYFDQLASSQPGLGFQTHSPPFGPFSLSYGASSLLSVDSPPARPGFYNGLINRELRLFAAARQKSLIEARMVYQTALHSKPIP